MIRQLITVLFAGYIICMADDQADKIGTIIDKICAKRLANSPLSRLDNEKIDKEDGDFDDDIEDFDDNELKPAETSSKASRKTFSGIKKVLSDEDSLQSSEETSNVNSNTNINTNIKRRNKPLFHARRFVIGNPNREMHRRMMNGLRRKLSGY